MAAQNEAPALPGDRQGAAVDSGAVAAHACLSRPGAEEPGVVMGDGRRRTQALRANQQGTRYTMALPVGPGACILGSVLLHSTP